MASFLEKLLGSRKAPPSADEFRAMQSDCEREVERTQAALEQAQRAYDASLVDDDPAATKAARGRWNDAEDAHARAVARLAKIREAFLQACEAEAEADRVANYDAGQKALKKARAAFTKYERSALEVRNSLVEIAEAEVVIAKANSDLPKDAAPVEGLEQAVRGLPSVPSRVVDERVEAVWVFRDWPEMSVPREKVSLIKSADGIRGYFEDPWASNSTDQHHVVKRKRIVRRTLPGVSAFRAVPLAATVALPGLAPGAAPIWSPVGGDWLWSENRPQAVLAAAKELEAAGKAATKDPRHHPETPDESVEWVDIDPADADVALAALGEM